MSEDARVVQGVLSIVWTTCPEALPRILGKAAGASSEAETQAGLLVQSKSSQHRSAAPEGREL